MSNPNVVGPNAPAGLTALTGDVTAGPGSGSQIAAVVSVGGSDASTVHAAAVAVAAATDADTVSTLVKRDSAGSFSGTTITASGGMSIASGQVYEFGLNDLNWAMGLNSGLFTNAFVVTSAVMVSVAGGAEDRGFAVGQRGGNSTLEIDGAGITHLMIGLAVGPAAMDASAIQQASSTTQGMLPPRMTTTQKNGITSPAEGLMVYDLSLHALCVYNGSAWKTVTAA